MQALSRTIGIFGVLRDRPFRSLWLGQIFSQLAGNMLLFILAFMVYQRTGSNAAVSALFLFYGVPAVIVGVIAGTIVDRLDRRGVLVFCDLTRAALTLVLLAGLGNLWVVYAFVFVSAILNQFYVPAEAPFIPLLVSKHLLVSANSLFSFSYYTSMGLGFILAGPVVRLVTTHGSLIGISVLFLLAALANSRLPVVRRGIRPIAVLLSYSVPYVASRIRSLLAEGIRYTAHSAILVDALVLLTGTQITLALLGALGPGFADTVLGIDVRDVSLVVVAPAVLGIVTGALWVGSFGVRYKTAKLMHIGIFGAGSILLVVAGSRQIMDVLPTTAPVFVGFILFFLLGFANACLDVPANSVLQEHSKGVMRGRIYGILTAAVGGVGMLPVVAAGFLADTIGVLRVLGILGVIICLYGVRRMRYNNKLVR